VKISIGKLIMIVMVGFFFIWLMFAYNVSNNNYHLNAYMDRYILVSLLYIVLLNVIINLLEYIRDNYV